MIILDIIYKGNLEDTSYSEIDICSCLYPTIYKSEYFISFALSLQQQVITLAPTKLAFCADSTSSMVFPFNENIIISSSFLLI